MATYPATPHDPVRHIAAGESIEDRSYRVRRPAGTEDWLAIVTVEGRGRIVHRGGALGSGPGDLLLYAPGYRQDYGTDPGSGTWHIAWAQFHPRPHWHPWLVLPPVEGAGEGLMHLRLEDAGTFERVLDALREAARMRVHPIAQAELFAHNALARALLWADCANPLTGGRPLDARVSDAIAYLCQNMASPITLDDLAAAVHLSTSRLSHLFREQVGITPIQYLESQRIERARQMLEQTSMPIGQIARQVGYESPFYFSLRFKKRTGSSPRAYRQALR
jgi:AraC family transcriptional regulator of arabinose operon